MSHLSQAVLVTGGSGYTGQFLIEYLLRHTNYAVFTSHNTTPLSTSNISSKLNKTVHSFQVDLCDRQSVAEMLGVITQNHYLHSVVNLAAMSRPIDCKRDPEKARKVNVPSTLIQELKQMFTSDELPLFVHVSTDQVYSGTRSYVTEEENLGPVNEYGRSKLEAEKYIIRELPHHYCILRSSLIYGPEPPFQPVPRPLFLQFIAQQVTSEYPCPFFTDEWRCPIYVQDVCKVITACIEKSSEGSRGVVMNMGGPERLARYDMAKLISEFLGADSRKLVSGLSKDIDRGFTSPEDTSTNSSLLFRVTGVKTTTLKDNLPALRLKSL